MLKTSRQAWFFEHSRLRFEISRRAGSPTTLSNAMFAKKSLWSSRWRQS
jgi:hypothetical protein